MAGCDGYVCMGCGKCYGLTAKGDGNMGTCMVCGNQLPDRLANRCPSCGAPIVKPVPQSRSAATEVSKRMSAAAKG